MSHDKPISDRTKVSLPLAIIGSMILITVTATLSIDRKLNKIEQGIERAWKIDEHQLWSDRLRTKNPTLKVPSVEDVRSGRRDRDIEASVGTTLGMKQ